MPKIPAIVFTLLALLSLAAGAPDETKAKGDKDHRTQTGINSFNLTVPAHDYDLILARPENNSITLSVLAYRDAQGFVTYGTQLGVCTNRTPSQQFKAGVPAELAIVPLQPDTKYFYQLHLKFAGTSASTNSPEFSFHTARPPGSSFTFTMTADAHLDEHTSSDVYLRTLANIQNSQADFHIDLGNLFMTDKHATRGEAARQYLAQRFYLGQIGGSTPVFLALGTHDGETAKYDEGSSDSLAVWSNLIRKRYFPNPVPDHFYSGDNSAKPFRGLLQNYYAWQWGDALFVVLDPFSYSLRQRGGDNGWSWSLGREQYEWLANTLAASRAKYKFVFIHNLLSGDQASRGGVEIAPFDEWGGKNQDGTDGFHQHRPGWEMPVHQLLVKNHVTAVFRAHDNFYARQEMDGILYLMIPQPSFAGNDRIRDLQAYGYKQGIFSGNSGHVRVSVASDKISVDYLKSGLAATVADNFIIRAK